MLRSPISALEISFLIISFGFFLVTLTPSFLSSCGLGSGRRNILENREKIPKSTGISVLIEQFSCKNWLIKDGGCLSILSLSMG
jgi:hypothetical protein